jgi:protein-disulfide isomerase-like protein with CxxC motif
LAVSAIISVLQADLERQIEAARAMGVSGFPSLMLDRDGSRWRVPVDYLDAGAILETIDRITTTLWRETPVPTR